MGLSDYTLVKLLPEQISAHWVKIAEGMSKSLPFDYVNKDVALNNLLHAALRDEVQVWLGVEHGEENIVVHCLVVTTIVGGGFVDPRRLWVLCLYGYRHIPESAWKLYASTLRGYAVRNDCEQIMAYSKVARVIEICTNGLGGDASTRLIIFNAREEVDDG